MGGSGPPDPGSNPGGAMVDLMKKELLAITLILVLSFILKSQFAFLKIPMWWDSCEFALNAKFFAGEKILFLAIRPPLLSLIMAPVSWSENLMKLVNVILSVLSVFMVYVIFRKFDRTIALLSSLIISTNMVFNYATVASAHLSSVIDPDTGIILFTLLSLYSFMNAKNKKLVFASGLINGISFLFKYPLIIVSFVGFLWLLYFRKEKRIETLFLWTSGFLVSIAPWLAYNFILFGNPLFSIISKALVFIHDKRFFSQSWFYYFENAFYFANPITIIFFFIGIVNKNNIRDKNRLLLLSFLFVFFLTFQIQMIKDVRYIIPILPVFVFFSIEGIKKISKKNKFPLFTIVLLVATLNIISLNSLNCKLVKENIEHPVGDYYAGLYLRNADPSAVIYTTNWPTIAYYSGHHVKMILDKDSFLKNLPYVDYVVFGNPGHKHPFLSKEFLDSLDQLEFIGKFGDEKWFRDVYIYKVKERYRIKDIERLKPLWNPLIK